MTEVIPVGPAATFSRLADCLTAGVCCAIGAAGVITAGPGLAAAATVVHSWRDGREAAVLPAFVDAVRTQTRALLGPQLALLGVLGVAWLDVATSASGLPGGAVIRSAGLVGGAFAVVSYLAMFAEHAARGGTWWSAWRRAATGIVRRPWLPVALLAALAATALMVVVAPPLVVVAGGPLMLAVGALYARVGA